jgi:hypothetical protein
MDLFIPLQTFEPSKVEVDSSTIQTRSLLSLSYKDTNVVFSNLSVMLPLTKVISYHIATGKLILDMRENPQLLQKLRVFQDNLISYIEANRSAWFPACRQTAEQIDSQFQKLVNQNVIVLYCPSSDSVTNGTKPIIPIYKDGWKVTLQSKDIVPGSHIRVALKFVGISFQLDAQKSWTGKFRIQHKITSVFFPASVPASADAPAALPAAPAPAAPAPAAPAALAPGLSELL